MGFWAGLTDWLKFVLILAVIAVIYVIYSAARYNQVKKRIVEMQNSLKTGDLVTTQSGLYGTIQALGKGVARIKLAEGLVIAIDRFSIKEKLDPEAVKSGLKSVGEEKKK